MRIPGNRGLHKGADLFRAYSIRRRPSNNTCSTLRDVTGISFLIRRLENSNLLISIWVRLSRCCEKRLLFRTWDRSSSSGQEAYFGGSLQ